LIFDDYVSCGVRIGALTGLQTPAAVILDDATRSPRANFSSV
jgi:hypothetical protein